MIPNKKENVSFTDEILAHVYNLRSLNKFTVIKTALKYRRLCRNYYKILMHILRKKYPIEANLRNGDSLIIRNYMEVQLDGGRFDGFEYDTTNDVVTLPQFSSLDNNSRVKIYGGVNNGSIRDIFVDNVYHRLPVKGKTVVDVGANIADSSIYFATHGAYRVIGLEPFPKNYELAQKNIEYNKLSNKVTILLAGCGTNKREIGIDPAYERGIDSILKDFDGGIKVPLLTLDNVLDTHRDVIRNTSVVLKMDCEGCEYETILSAAGSTLKKFSHIIIEYHFGYKNLKEKLEKNNFKVSVTRPNIYTLERSKHQEGYVFAEKNW